MAGCFERQGLFEQALAHYHTAQKIMIKELGANHADVAATFTNMSVVYSAQVRVGRRVRGVRCRVQGEGCSV